MSTQEKPRREIIEFSGYGHANGKLEDGEISIKLWKSFPFEARWEALREMLAFFYERDLNQPNPFPIDKIVENYGSLSERWAVK